MRVISHGLRVGPNAEFSVDDPMANSSIFNLPNGIAPAARSFAMTVASYGAMYPWRIFEAQLQGCPSTLMTSLMEIGTPPRGRRKSTRWASEIARSRSYDR